MERILSSTLAVIGFVVLIASGPVYGLLNSHLTASQHFLKMWPFFGVGALILFAGLVWHNHIVGRAAADN